MLRFRSGLQLFALALAVTIISCREAAPPAAPLDPANALVFARYPRTPMPTKLELDVPSKFNILTAPATLEDVSAGRAIFSFEGLGEHRVWKPPEPVIYADWKKVTNYVPRDKFGNEPNGFAAIRQMEELKVNGRWELYFGLVLHSGAVVVPADEVYFSMHEEGSVSYLELPGGLDWGVQTMWRSTDDSFVIAPKAPAIIRVYLCNRSAVCKALPVGFFRTGKHPALRDGVTLHLERAPFNARAAESEYPEDEDYVELAPPVLGHFASARTRTFQPGEVIEDFQLDLRSAFPDLSAGFYLVHFTFDRVKLGLPDESTMGAGSIEFGFIIGTPPRQLTAAELNRDIPPLGSADAVSRLDKLIRCQLPTVLPPSPAEPKDFTPAVAGLALRIDAARLDAPYNIQYLLRIKNVGNQPVELPASWRTCITSRIQQQDGKWLDGPVPQPVVEDTSDASPPVPPPPFILAPGQSAGIYAEGEINGTCPPQNIILTLAIPKGRNAAVWSGALASPAARISASWPAATLAAPTFLIPGPSPQRYPYNGSGDEPETEFLYSDHYGWTQSLAVYDPASRREKLESLLTAARTFPDRAFFASLAAAVGSRTAALELLSMLQHDDEASTHEARGALGFALTDCDNGVPPWLAELAAAAISDRRYVIHSRISSNRYLHIGELEDDLVLRIGWAKVSEAVPALLALANDPHKSSGVFNALANIGDPRALPVVLKNLEAKPNDHGHRELNEDVVDAAGRLHIEKAVPILLRHLDDPQAIEALREIGDPQIKAPLEKLVATKGKLENDPQADSAELAAARLFAARLTLAWLAGPDGVPAICELARDQSLDENQRRDAVWLLGDRSDPRAIPTLLDAIKEDPSGVVVNQAIFVLSVYKYRAAVAGLIDCFDADFTGKADYFGNNWKRAYKPEMFRANLAEALRAITGESFGPDKKLWANWWRDNATTCTDLP